MQTKLELARLSDSRVSTKIMIKILVCRINLSKEKKMLMAPIFAH